MKNLRSFYEKQVQSQPEPMHIDIEIFVPKTRYKRTVYRVALITASIVLFLSMGMYSTATALNNWTPPSSIHEFMNIIFGDSPTIPEVLQDEPPYEVVTNTFNGITFEVSSLYADNNSVILTVDIFSEEPRFSENHSYGSMMHGRHYGFRNIEKDYYYINEYQMTVVFRMNDPIAEIKAGNKYTIRIGDFIDDLDDSFKYSEAEDNPEAVITVKINSIDTTNNYSRLTNIPLNNQNPLTEPGIVLYKIDINPFVVQFHFYSDIGFDTLDWSWGSIYNDDYSHELLSEINESVYFRMRDNEIRCFLVCDVCRDTISGGGAYPDSENTYIVQYNFALKHTINTSDIEAVVFQGIEMPVS